MIFAWRPPRVSFYLIQFHFFYPSHFLLYSFLLIAVAVVAVDVLIALYGCIIAIIIIIIFILLKWSWFSLCRDVRRMIVKEARIGMEWLLCSSCYIFSLFYFQCMFIIFNLNVSKIVVIKVEVILGWTEVAFSSIHCKYQNSQKFNIHQLCFLSRCCRFFLNTQQQQQHEKFRFLSLMRNAFQRWWSWWRWFWSLAPRWKFKRRYHHLQKR